ncbi:MAG: hypothetical protein COA83_04330 [Methylophaga sp.]|nr:MAG: hypothetical protein COA83_04330 [Methylophaga sp.]
MKSTNQKLTLLTAWAVKPTQYCVSNRFRLQACRNEVTEGSMTAASSIARSQAKRYLQSGFTLLEMVLVLFLIGLMASATLMLTENVEDQAKYDETKRRMAMMRTAIVGDPTRTINGGPEISGFVADMGRLPNCVAELLESGDERSPATDPKEHDSPCIPSEIITAWDIDASTGLGSGWRGPYIQVLPERNGDLRFRDGYGNTGTDASGAGGTNLDASTVFDDERYSGWSWRLYNSSGTLTPDASTATSIRLQSYDLNGLNKYPSGDIETSDASVARQLELVKSADWEVELPATVNVTFKNQSAGDLPIANENLVLRLYLSDLSTAIDGNDDVNDYLVLDANSAISGIPKTKNFTLISTPKIPIGTRAYSIVCFEEPATGNFDDYVIFDGDCNAGNDTQDTSNIRIFSVVPRQSLNLNLDWIIP